MLAASRRIGRADVQIFRAGSRRAAGRCPVPPLFRADWVANDAGAMLVAGGEGDGRVLAATARPGGCFARHQQLARRSTAEDITSVLLSETGRTLVAWTGPFRPERFRYGRFASGQAGRRFGRVRELPRRLGGRRLSFVLPSFIAEDRVLWNATYWRGDEFLVHAATSAPRAGRLGRFRSIGADAIATDLTDRRGGQVFATDMPGGALHIYSRRPGRPYGPPRDVPTGEGMSPKEAVGNPAGDTAFLLSDGFSHTVVIRRRNGTIEGPHVLRNVHGLRRVAATPGIAIDRRGRVVVAWSAQHDDPDRYGPSEVQVAQTNRAGEFGPVRAIARVEAREFEDVHVALNGHGRVAVAFLDVEMAPVGVVGTTAMLVRGRLGR